jgi:hypothetical protein
MTQLKFRLVWSPSGSPIGEVWASDERAAVKKTPRPWSKFKGEVYAERIVEDNALGHLQVSGWSRAWSGPALD